MADDFFFMHQEKLGCKIIRDTFINICKDIGVPVSKEKTTDPSQNTEFLGVMLNTVSEIASLPLDKITTYEDHIHSCIVQKRISIKEAQSLAGKLCFATAVVPGRAFLRRIYDTIAAARDNFLFISNDMRKDLKTWNTFLHEFNGSAFYRLADPFMEAGIHMGADACKLGFGAIFGSKWLLGSFTNFWKRYHISTLELFPILVLIETFGTSIKNSIIRFHTDNTQTRDMINNQTSTNKANMKIIRRLVLVLLKFNIHLKAQHISGNLNILCDKISRFQVNTQLLEQYGMDATPTPIPTHLWPANFSLS